ncbi:ATP-dependent endonuclease [Spirochaetia bacterium]|nr:ATP-dependent endonuclease [Spirochaetia bacterium]
MNHIEKIKIVNYKCFKGTFILPINDGVNIIVGNNESGKTTILEAIHLALSGILNGKYLKNELSQYIFNKEIENEYIESLKTTNPIPPPHILIEIYFSGDQLPLFEGDGNSERKKASGISLKIEFDLDDYQEDYEELLKTEDVKTIPIEFYKITWMSFARDIVSIKSIPIKSVLIDSTSTRFQNGSDVYISKIIRDNLSIKEIVDLSQAYRKLKELFMDDKSIKSLNEKITNATDISSKLIEISVDLSVKNSWETSLMTYFDNIPFHQIGMGEQCLVKTNLALAHRKTKESNLILIEEPENHLSHTKLNQFINSIRNKCEGKQIIITTHSNFVANKLGLEHLILLNNQNQMPLKSLSKETYEYFEKLPGYETLRILLCKKVVLVEGPSDELIIQRAYMDRNDGKLPIENEIDVISVRGLSFKRFLEIAKIIKKPMAVVTDNDGDYNKNIKEKYSDYFCVDTILISASNNINLKTLEPQIANANNKNLKTLCEILELNVNSYNEENLISEYMQKKENKTDCALKIFNSENTICYPDYINNVIEWCNE